MKREKLTPPPPVEEHPAWPPTGGLAMLGQVCAACSVDVAPRWVAVTWEGGVRPGAAEDLRGASAIAGYCCPPCAEFAREQAGEVRVLRP